MFTQRLLTSYSFSCLIAFIGMFPSSKPIQAPWPQHQQCNRKCNHILQTAAADGERGTSDAAFALTENVEEGNPGIVGRYRAWYQALPTDDKGNSKLSNYRFHQAQADAD